MTEKPKKPPKITNLFRARLSLKCCEDGLKEYESGSGHTNEVFVVALAVKHLASAMDDILIEMEKRND